MAVADLSIVALIISLVALLTTLLQLLQQYYATADGYRRCQNSVIAGWAAWTHRHFRWYEFRFETIFVVPHITFLECRSCEGDETLRKKEELASGNEDWQGNREGKKVGFEEAHWRVDEYAAFCRGWAERGRLSVATGELDGLSRDKGGRLSGDEEKARQQQSSGSAVSRVKPRKEELWDTNVPGELACWVSLMKQLHKMQVAFKKDSGGHFGDGSVSPVFSGRRRSWDFVAPDIIRPYITISLCDLVVVARLLGMRWTTFDPVKGVLQAEGHDYLMNSRVLQTVGTFIDFHVVRSTGKTAEAAVERWYIPESQVYRMMFGIIPADPQLLKSFAASGFRVSGRNEWHRTIEDILDATGSSGNIDDIDYLAADFLPLVAPMLRKRHSRIIRVPKPYINQHSWLGLRRVYQQFPEELKSYVEAELKSSTDKDPPALFSQTVLAACEELHRHHHLRNFWEHRWPKDLVSAEASIVQFCDFTAEKFDLAQNHLLTLLHDPEKGQLEFFYQELVLCHLALLSRSQTVKATRAHGEKSGLLDRVRLSDYPQERLKFLFNGMDGICAELRKKYPKLEKRDIKEAWVAMMFRAMCWRRCHGVEVDDDEPVPSEYWKSQQEVYIG